MTPDLSILDGALAAAVKSEAAALRAHADAVEAWGRTRRAITAAVAADDKDSIRDAVLDHYEDEMRRRACYTTCEETHQRTLSIHTETIVACTALREKKAHV
jgi:hypothetical protein